MQIQCDRDLATMDYMLSGRISALEVLSLEKMVIERAIDRIAAAVADRFLGDHLQDVLSLLDPRAIANLAVADAAGAIRETLHAKLPDKILEVVKTELEVYQRGVFGGMSRIR